MTEETKTEKVTVGSIACAAIREGKTNEEALKAVQEAIPDAKTSLASINWYRNKLRADGEDVPTASELKKKAREEAKAAEAEAKDVPDADDAAGDEAADAPEGDDENDPLED